VPQYYSLATAQPCRACPPGGRCTGGPVGAAVIFTDAGRWLDEGRNGTLPIIYACFADHCSGANGTVRCGANNGTGCCAEGRHGLLCESCMDGFTKQNDVCVPCADTDGGSIWGPRLVVKMLIKVAMISLVCATLLIKATKASYTVTISFATIVFSLQTSGLVAKDSFGGLGEGAPGIAAVVDVVLMALNPDQVRSQSNIWFCSTYPRLQTSI
jgi:hypothetical protein